MKIVITGTSSGIGRGLALRYCEAGHEVWGIARRDQRDFAAARKDCGQSFRASRVDVARAEEVEAWRQEVTAAWGKVDALICGAGIQGPLGPSMKLTPRAWQESLNVNLNGPFNVILAMHALLLNAERRAKIVCFSGGGSTAPRPFFTAYAVAKTGIVRLVENLAQEWTASPIDINAVAPGAVNTHMTDEVLAAGPEVVGENEHRKTIEQKRNGGTPFAKVGEVIDFLVSPESDGISGRLISGLWDPYGSLPQRREQIAKSDIYTLRRIVPQDRGLDWK